MDKEFHCYYVVDDGEHLHRLDVWATEELQQALRESNHQIYVKSVILIKDFRTTIYIID